MVDFSKRGDVRRWLERKRHEVAVIFATRQALRVAPLLDSGTDASQLRVIALPVFRALATPWAVGQYPAHGAEFRNAAAIASSAAGATRPANGYAAYAAAACIAAADAADADAYAYAVNAAGAYAAYATAFASQLATASADAADAALIDQGVSAAALAGRRLWLTVVPKWANDEWNRLQDALLADNQDWTVWTDWYLARLEGRPAIEALEVARVTIAEALWQQGPRAVNAEIAKLVAEHALPPTIDAVPTQIPHALVFGGDDTAPIGLVDPPGEGINDTADQRQSHADIREKASLLENACGNSNRLAILKGTAAKLSEAMGASILELRVRASWAQMNALRRRAEADERARASPDPDDPPMPEEAAGHLYDLRDALNVFAAHEPKLTALDESARDPAERIATAATLAAARRIGDAAKAAPAAVERPAADSLAQASSEASGTSPADERAKEFSVKSSCDLILEATRRD